MGIISGLFKAMGAVNKAFGRKSNSVAEYIELEELLLELHSKVDTLMPFAQKADESYRLLVYENLQSVPAVELYDGEYVERLNDLIDAVAYTENPSKVERQLDKIPQLATEIQTYLNEETSDLEAAKLWDSKYIKGVIDHIPPHLRKGESYDETMAQVMEAFRNWSSFAQASIDMYGSQRLINATYEAVMDGDDALSYMNEILDLNSRDNQSFGKGLHEDVIVPFAGFFGGGFFF